MPDLKSALPLLLAPALLAQPAVQAPPPGRAPQAAAQEDALSLMLKARALQLRAGGSDPAGAAALYRRVIALVPSSAEAHLRLSEALEESKDLEGALAEARKSVALGGRGEAYAQVGLIQYRRAVADAKLVPEAKKALHQAADRLPMDVEVWARLGEMAEADKDNEEALRAWLRVGHLRPTLDAAWERAAIHAWALKRYPARREAVLALCQRDPQPRHLKMLEDLAREQVESGYLAHAEESFRLLARHLPQEAAIWENIALVQLRIPRYAEALQNLERAEELKPTPRVSLNAALCLLNLRRIHEAELRVQKLMVELPLQEVPDRDRLEDWSQELYAQSLMLQERPKDLLAWMARVAPRPGAAGDLAILRVQALIQTGAYSAARKALEEGMALYKDRPFFQEAVGLPTGFLKGMMSRKDTETRLRQMDLQAMAELWASIRQWDTCLAALDKARALGPVRNVDLLLLESNAYEQLQRPQDSLRVLREAQALAPANAMLQNNLGYSLLESGGDLDEAARLIEASAKQEPGNGNTLDSLGWVQFKQGKVDEAEKTLRKAVELNPFSPEVRRHLGEVLLKLSRPDEAAEQWERALAFAFPDRPALEKKLEQLRLDQAKRHEAAVKDTGDDAEDDEP
ncbi:MAG TPA: tetratricopeptide repeat protein [Holophagaceae bacterium]|nr:tetratricopeptide repeat protein [Holophagaceae bacterium]